MERKRGLDSSEMAGTGNGSRSAWLHLESLLCTDAIKSYTSCALLKEFPLDEL